MGCEACSLTLPSSRFRIALEIEQSARHLPGRDGNASDAIVRAIGSLLGEADPSNDEDAGAIAAMLDRSLHCGLQN